MMTKIKPFPGVTYNFNKIQHLNRVICPPYDIITPAQTKSYRRLSHYNMVNLTLPEQALDKKHYQKAAWRFSNWLEKGVFCQEKEPAIYFYQQEFKIDQTRHKRLGFIACLSLSSSPSIYGHEHTRIEPKEDRFKLLLKAQANLEPIFVLFSDPQQFVNQIFKRYVLPSKPLIRFLDREKNTNIFWRLTKPDILERMRSLMANKIIFIADGHHRYEVSLSYQNLMRKRHAGKKDKDFNYILVYFCPIQSPDLVVKPVHRLVKGIDHFPTDKFKQFFYIKKTTRSRLLKLIQSETGKQRIIGMYSNKKFYILVLKHKQFLNKISKAYRSLDVCLLNHLILKKLLRLKPDDRQRVVFSANVQDLIRQVDIDKSSLVFFLKPAKISDITRLARVGKKMPTKTTYFYPKVPSGLVIYKFNK